MAFVIIVLYEIKFEEDKYERKKIRIRINETAIVKLK